MFIKDRRYREMITVTSVGAWYLHRNWKWHLYLK